MFGKVREVPQRESTLLLAAVPVRRSEVIRPLHGDQLPRVVRHARILGKVTQAAARIWLGIHDSLSLGNLDAKRYNRTAPTTTSWPPARRTPYGTCSRLPSRVSGSKTGPPWSCRILACRPHPVRAHPTVPARPSRGLVQLFRHRGMHASNAVIFTTSLRAGPRLS